MRALLLLVLTALLRTYSYADTTFVSGVQSGTWSPATGDPYLVTGVITIPEGQSLTIEAGTRIVFTNGHGFIVNGAIFSNGTETNPVVFTQDTVDYPVRWRGVRLFSQQDTSRFTYTRMSNGDGYYGLIRVGPSRAVISHCEFSGMTLIAVEINEGGWAEVTDCVMRDRFGTSGGWGAGITVWAATAKVERCRFENLFALDGGALEVTLGGHAVFRDCIFENNHALIWGGVAYIYGSEVTFENCVFRGNYGNVGTIARVNGNAATTFSRCVFEDNYNYGGSWGLLEFEEGGPHLVDHCLFIHNDVVNTWPYHNMIFGGASTTVTHSVFFQNYGNPVISGYGVQEISNCAFGSPANMQDPNHDDLPPGFGQLVETNSNGDSTDAYGNLFVEPLFNSGGPYGEFSLHHTSHLINAGDPAYELDPDGTISDLGPYPFYRLDPIEDLTVMRDGESDDLVLHWSAISEANEYWIFASQSNPWEWNQAEWIGVTDNTAFVHMSAFAQAKRNYVVIASQTSHELSPPLLNR